MRLQMRERLGAPTGAVAQDPRHRKRRVVIEERAGNPTEKGEGADMAVEKGFRRLPRIRLHEPQIGMRQDQAEEGDLLSLPADLDYRLAEVDLGMARRVMERNESLARRLPTGPDIILHDRIPAREPVLVAQPLENPVRRVPLLARHVRIGVRLQDRVDDAGEPVQLRPPHRLPPPVARRRRIAQHLLHRPAVDPEPPTGLVMAQSLVDNSQTNRRIELHAVHPSPLVATDKGPSVAQFCAAATGPPGRSAWGIIPPPLTHDLVRKPDAGNPHVRFDERGTGNEAMGAGLRTGAKATEQPPDPKVSAPAPDSTISAPIGVESARRSTSGGCETDETGHRAEIDGRMGQISARPFWRRQEVHGPREIQRPRDHQREVLPRLRPVGDRRCRRQGVARQGKRRRTTQ